MEPKAFSARDAAAWADSRVRPRPERISSTLPSMALTSCRISAIASASPVETGPTWLSTLLISSRMSWRARFSEEMLFLRSSDLAASSIPSRAETSLPAISSMGRFSMVLVNCSRLDGMVGISGYLLSLSTSRTGLSG